jgi:predicted DNA-binding transcriptional regulator YafY
VTATVRDTEQLHWWLLGFGSMVTVVSPDSLRVEMAQDLANAARAYVAPVPTPSNQGDFT